MEQARTIVAGDVEITSVWDGTLAAGIETILRLDPAEARHLIDAEKALTGADPLVLPVRTFLVRTAGRLALIDTGSGTTKGPTMGHLPTSLATIGLRPADIDSVILTHLHMDHIGGLIDDTGRAAFPRAELVMHRAEARFFLDTPESELDARSRRNVEFQRRAVAAYGSRVRRVDDGDGIPGVAARLAPGHTPGHTCWEIGTGADRIVVLGDVVHLGAVQLPRPSTPMIYDVDPDLAVQTRIAMLARLADSGTRVVGAHVLAPGLGRIVRSGDGYRFVPAQSG